MRGVFNDANAICFGFLNKNIFYRYSFELPRIVGAIQTSTYNMYFHKDVNKSTRTVI